MALNLKKLVVWLNPNKGLTSVSIFPFIARKTTPATATAPAQSWGETSATGGPLNESNVPVLQPGDYARFVVEGVPPGFREDVAIQLSINSSDGKTLASYGGKIAKGGKGWQFFKTADATGIDTSHLYDGTPLFRWSPDGVNYYSVPLPAAAAAGAPTSFDLACQVSVADGGALTPLSVKHSVFRVTLSDKIRAGLPRFMGKTGSIAKSCRVYGRFDKSDAAGVSFEAIFTDDSGYPSQIFSLGDQRTQIYPGDKSPPIEVAEGTQGICFSTVALPLLSGATDAFLREANQVLIAKSKQASAAGRFDGITVMTWPAKDKLAAPGLTPNLIEVPPEDVVLPPIAAEADKLHQEYVDARQAYVDYVRDPDRASERILAQWVTAILGDKKQLAGWVGQKVIDLGFSDAAAGVIAVSGMVPDGAKPGGPVYDFLKQDEDQRKKLNDAFEDKSKQLTEMLEGDLLKKGLVNATWYGAARYAELLDWLGQSVNGRAYLVKLWQTPDELYSNLKTPAQFDQFVSGMNMITGNIGSLLSATFVAAFSEFGPVQAEFYADEGKAAGTALEMLNSDRIAAAMGLDEEKNLSAFLALNNEHAIAAVENQKATADLVDAAEEVRNLKFPADQMLRVLAAFNFTGTMVALVRDPSKSTAFGAARAGVGFASLIDTPDFPELMANLSYARKLIFNRKIAVDMKAVAQASDAALATKVAKDTEELKTALQAGKLKGLTTKLTQFTKFGKAVCVLQGIGDFVAGMISLKSDIAHGDTGAEIADMVQMGDGLLLALGGAIALTGGGLPLAGVLIALGTIAQLVSGIISLFYPSRSDLADWMLHCKYGKEPKGTVVSQIKALNQIIYSIQLTDLDPKTKDDNPELSGDMVLFTIKPGGLSSYSTVGPISVLVKDGSGQIYQLSTAQLGDYMNASKDSYVVSDYEGQNPVNGKPPPANFTAINFTVPVTRDPSLGFSVEVSMTADVEGNQETVVSSKAKAAWTPISKTIQQ